MSDRSDVVEALRGVADALERHPDSSMTGEVVFSRWFPVTREEMSNWVKAGSVYASPLSQDRTQTTTLTFDIRGGE